MSTPSSALSDIARRLLKAASQWVTIRSALLSRELQLNVRRMMVIVALGALTGCFAFSAWFAFWAWVVLVLIERGTPWSVAVLAFVVATAATSVLLATVAMRLTSRLRFSPLVIPSETQTGQDSPQT